MGTTIKKNAQPQWTPPKGHKLPTSQAQRASWTLGDARAPKNIRAAVQTCIRAGLVGTNSLMNCAREILVDKRRRPRLTQREHDQLLEAAFKASASMGKRKGYRGTRRARIFRRRR